MFRFEAEASGIGFGGVGLASPPAGAAEPPWPPQQLSPPQQLEPPQQPRLRHLNRLAKKPQRRFLQQLLHVLQQLAALSQQAGSQQLAALSQQVVSQQLDLLQQRRPNKPLKPPNRRPRLQQL